MWSFTPGANGNGNTTYEGEHSIPGEIALLDSDYDGFTDRLYAADTGGDVWRFDLPTDNPVGSEPWTAVQMLICQLLAMNVDSSISPRWRGLTLVKHPNTPLSLMKSLRHKLCVRKLPYEAIVLGSGNRAHPLDESENNHLIMLRDENTITQSLQAEDIPAVITMDDLMDITNDPFTAKLNDDSGFVELEKDLAQFSGGSIALVQMRSRCRQLPWSVVLLISLLLFPRKRMTYSSAHSKAVVVACMHSICTTVQKCMIN